jgi:crooked neck
LEKIPKARAKELFDAYTAFEKKYGDREGVETVILSKRRYQYEQEASAVHRRCSCLVLLPISPFLPVALACGTPAGRTRDGVPVAWRGPLQVKENPYNYDAWFDFVRLAESEGNLQVIRDVYERAIANVPLEQEKRYWRRYIYLWIYYAVFEELIAKVWVRALQAWCRPSPPLAHSPIRLDAIARIWSGRMPCIRHAWSSSRTRSSPLPRSGS